jgi:IclR family transcriptional regulator, acetate operon repressor
MAVLGMFGPQAHSLSLSEIAEALGAYPSSTSRLLQTLEDGGFLVRDRESGRYRLGTRLLELAGNVMADFDIRTIARPHLRRLSYDSGESVSLGYYDNLNVVYLDSFPGTHTFHLSVTIGARHPAWQVASGRSLLALMPEEAERLLVDKSLSPVTRKELEGELEGIRDRGYALDEGNFLAGIHAAASAVVGKDEAPLVAVSMVAPAGRLPPDKIEAAGERVKRTAKLIAAEIDSGSADINLPL